MVGCPPTGPVPKPILAAERIAISRTRFLDRASAPHIATLVLATATGTLAMNVFLPSMPGMARYFETDYANVQLAVSIYLAGNALLQPVLGPLADYYGRRPVLLASLATAVLGTIVCIYSTSIEMLLFGRGLQAFSAAGLVLGRAIVRDLYDGDRAASMLGYVTMAMALAPMVAPAIGGYLDELYGWQASFLLILVFTIAAIVLIFFDLGETNPNPGRPFAEQVAGYPQLLRSRRFWGYTLAAAFTSGCFFAFLGGGPYVADVHYHLSPFQYGLLFALMSFGYMVGNFLAGRYSRRFGINKMMLAGCFLAAAGLLLSLLLVMVITHHPLAFFAPVAIVGIGNGIALPNLNAGIVSVRPDLAGSASGLGGFLQIGGGALLSVFAGYVLGPETGPTPLLILMFTSSICAIMMAFYVIHIHNRVIAEQS